MDKLRINGEQLVNGGEQQNEKKCKIGIDALGGLYGNVGRCGAKCMIVPQL